MGIGEHPCGLRNHPSSIFTCKDFGGGELEGVLEHRKGMIAKADGRTPPLFNQNIPNCIFMRGGYGIKCERKFPVRGQ